MFIKMTFYYVHKDFFGVKDVLVGDISMSPIPPPRLSEPCLLSFGNVVKLWLILLLTMVLSLEPTRSVRQMTPTSDGVPYHLRLYHINVRTSTTLDSRLGRPNGNSTRVLPSRSTVNYLSTRSDHNTERLLPWDLRPTFLRTNMLSVRLPKKKGRLSKLREGW